MYRDFFKMTISKLKREELYRVCDPKKFDFTSTADLEERLSALGQDRAISAVELGINIKSKGYNLFWGRKAPERQVWSSVFSKKRPKAAQLRTTGLMFTILKNPINRLQLIFLPEKRANLPKTSTN